MPLFLEPGQKYPVVLDSDLDKPKSEQPTFFAKSQAMRGQQKIGDVLDLWTNEPDITHGTLFDATIAILREVFSGWVNMGEHVFPEAMRDVLSYSEARELLRKVMHNQHITTDEKKSSESHH